MADLAIHHPSAGLNGELDTLRRRAWRVSLAIWIFELLLLELIRMSGGLALTWQLAAGRVVWFAGGLLVGVAVWKLAEPLHRLAFWKLATIVMLFFLGLGSVHTIANRALFFWILDSWPPQDRIMLEYYTMVRYWLHFYMAWAAIILALIYAMKARREELGRSAAQAMARQAQIQALKYQIHPHFLFNSFNSVAAMILDGEFREAEQLIRRLSTYLRRSLSKDATEDIPLQREVALAVEYLELERVRFPDRLVVETIFAADGDNLRAMVPGFILQPLVENAMRHSVLNSRQPTIVRISAARSGDRLVLVVENTGSERLEPPTEAGPSTGLGHVRSRLYTRFSNDFILDAAMCDECSYRVRIAMPFVGESE